MNDSSCCLNIKISNLLPNQIYRYFNFIYYRSFLRSIGWALRSIIRRHIETSLQLWNDSVICVIFFLRRALKHGTRKKWNEPGKMSCLKKWHTKNLLNFKPQTWSASLSPRCCICFWSCRKKNNLTSVKICGNGTCKIRGLSDACWKSLHNFFKICCNIGFLKFSFDVKAEMAPILFLIF